MVDWKVNPEAAVGAVTGALTYIVSAKDRSIVDRTLLSLSGAAGAYFSAQWVGGYWGITSPGGVGLVAWGSATSIVYVVSKIQDEWNKGDLFARFRDTFFRLLGGTTQDKDK